PEGGGLPSSTIATGCSPSSTSRPITGSTCARPIQSSRHSRTVKLRQRVTKGRLERLGVRVLTHGQRPAHRMAPPLQPARTGLVVQESGFGRWVRKRSARLQAVYFHNAAQYQKLEPLGAWKGENTNYLGGGRFAGLGLTARNEEAIDASLFRELHRAE